MKYSSTHLVVLLLFMLLVSPAVPAQNSVESGDSASRAGNLIKKGNVGGYLITQREKVDESYNAGYSMYVAAYPLLREYPGREFQSGLFGTWMHPHYDAPLPVEKLYTDVEGGLGWWRDTEYATATPKFIMGGVQRDFIGWANGPGAGQGRDWENPKGKYGVAQLSPWVLWPPDGLNLKQGTCGELFGSGYLPLPLTEPKSTTAGKEVSTGNQCWTLFLNTGNFKGPVAFFTPYFWTEASVADPRLDGLFLDQRPSGANKAFQMETQHIHSFEATDSKGQRYARMAPTQYAAGPDGNSELLHRLMVYKKAALWEAVEAWFKGGAVADSRIDISEAVQQEFKKGVRSNWSFYGDHIPKDQRALMNITSYMDPNVTDAATLRVRWDGDLVTKKLTKDGYLITLPEYYKLVKADADDKGEWIAVSPEEVPAETGLHDVDFSNQDPRNPIAYITPSEKESCWKTPGPVAGPFYADLGDGSTVTYYWYRFADQPALLNADLSSGEREELQRRVELLHRNWTKDREYLPAPLIGTLAEIDPALIVTPPKGMEVGYVPIVTQQGITVAPKRTANAAEKPLKVYLLAGQSNMQGSAHYSTFEAIGDDPETKTLLNQLLDQEGNPVVSDNAWISYRTQRGERDTVIQGKVKVGYGFDEERIGPEYAFGLFMDQAHEEPVLIIKTAWGGKSLAVDFRPPGAGPYEASLKEKEQGTSPSNDEVGKYYREMIRHIRATLGSPERIRELVPGYDPVQGYELAGFVWFQGWNDMCNRHHIEQYTENMIHFIQDVRKEFDQPDLPFIVGILGVYGTDPDSRKFDKSLPVSDFRKAQFAAVEQYDLKVPASYRGNVKAVDSGPYYELELSDIYWKQRLTNEWEWRVKQGEMTREAVQKERLRYGFSKGGLTKKEKRIWERCASNAEYHYLGSGKTFVRFGKALAEELLEMEEQ